MTSIEKLNAKGCLITAVVVKQTRKFFFFKKEQTFMYSGRGINPLMAYKELMRRMPEEHKANAVYFPRIGDIILINEDGKQRFDVEVKGDAFLDPMSFDYEDLVKHATETWKESDTIPGGIAPSTVHFPDRMG